MTIALSHSGTSVYSSPAPSDDLLVGTVDGIVALRRAGSNWRVGVRALEGIHVHAIIFPTPDLSLAALEHGGIMLSRDGGLSWERRDHGLAHPNLYSLAATRLDGRVRLFAGTEPAHLYISDDLGANWRESAGLCSVPTAGRWTFPGPPHLAHVKVITVAPDDPATVYACIEQGDLLRSRDGGESWQVLSGFGEEFDYDLHRLVIHPKNPACLYMVGGLGLWVSEDRGGHWERRTGEHGLIGGYPDQMTYVPSRPEMFFASGARGNPGSWRRMGGAGARIAISRDRARSWEILNDGLPAPEQWRASIEAMTLEEWGESFSIFAATTAGEVFASDDGARSWSRIASGLAPISKGGHYKAFDRAALAGPAAGN